MTAPKKLPFPTDNLSPEDFHYHQTFCFVPREVPKKAEKFQFSLKQSAVLYTMFLLNALTTGLLDLVIQIVNIRYSQCKRPGQCDVANIEQMTVLESLMEVDPINKAYMGILFSNTLAFEVGLLHNQLEEGIGWKFIQISSVSISQTVGTGVVSSGQLSS